MPVADIVLAAFATIACAAICAVAGLFAMNGAFVPAPDAEPSRLARNGCLVQLLAVAAFVYFAGVMVTADWAWAQWSSGEASPPLPALPVAHLTTEPWT